MYLRRSLWLAAAVGMVFTVIAHAQDTTLVTLATANGGRAIVYGNIMPETTFVIQARVRISGADTTWIDGLYLNGTSTRVESVVETSKVAVDQNLYRMDAANRVHIRRMNAVMENDSIEAARPLIDVLRDEYASNTAMVDSVGAVEGYRFRVFWHNDLDGEYIKLPRVHDVPTTKQSLLTQLAGQLARKLNQHDWVFISDGGAVMESFRGPMIERCQADMSALQHATKSPEQTVFINREIAQHINRPPVTLEELHQEVHGHE